MQSIVRQCFTIIFHNREMLQRLRLSITQTHSLIQCISNANTATHQSVSVHLGSTYTEWHTTIDCVILPNITGTIETTKLDTSSLKIHRDIDLAYEQFDQPGSIDPLIGTDLFYEMLRSGWRTRPCNYPFLQETVLGWILSG